MLLVLLGTGNAFILPLKNVQNFCRLQMLQMWQHLE